MKPFNYEEAKKDLSKIVTRDRRHLEVLDIHLMNAEVPYPLVVAYRDELEFVGTHEFTEDGKFVVGDESDLDLFLKADKKLIDWSELPDGTLVETTEGLRYISSDFDDDYERVCAYIGGASSETAGGCVETFSMAELVEQPEFTVWMGGDCPVPEGVLVGVVTREGRLMRRAASTLRWNHKGREENYREVDIIAYRIIGVQEDYSPYFQGREF